MLRREVPLVSRGSIPLKGKSAPMEVFAPVPVEAPSAEQPA